MTRITTKPIMSSPVQPYEYAQIDNVQDLIKELLNTVLVAIRQGIFFGIETRIPYAITSILRPQLFNKPGRPLAKSVVFFADQTIAHGWVIARIAVIFKLTERLLATVENLKRPREWHTFVAGALAGYLIMAKDTTHDAMKKQINMAIGIRTIYAVMAYFVRQGAMPGISHTKEGYTTGTNLFYTLMWGFVMWHWRHQAPGNPEEMNSAQVSQMDFIYNDFGIAEKWTESTHLLWLIALLAVRRFMK